LALSDKIPFLQKINFDDLYNAFLGLDRRRQTAFGVAAALGALALLFLPMSCVSEQLGAKQADYDKYVARASEFFGILNEYGKLQKGLDRVQESFSKMGADSLSTVIYNMAEEIGIQKSKVELKSVNLAENEAFQEVGKEVSMRDVQFDELMKFMDKLSSYDQLPLSIKKASIKADPNKRNVMHQVSFTVSTIKPNK
jgi:hypothetical protein